MSARVNKVINLARISLQARKVVEMASAYDVMVIPHGSSIYSYHLQYAFTNCPMAEYICLSEQVCPYQCTCHCNYDFCLGK